MKEKLKLLANHISIVIPLLLISAYSSSTDAIAPILRSMEEAFPAASLTLVQMTVTLPSAVSIPVQLLTVPLSQFMTKKQMMIVAISLVCIGGLIPLVFHSSIIFVVISSVIIGIGQGFFMPTSNALIAELFDGNTRGAFLGIKNGVSGFLRSILTLLVGFLGAAVWYKAYFIFIIMIPFIALFIWKTPNGEKGAKIAGKGVGLSGLKGVLTPAFIVIIFFSFCATFSQMAYLTNISGFIADKGLGDAAAAGTATAFNTMARFIVGIALGFILRVFKKFTLPFGYLLNATGYFIILNASGMMAVQVGGIIFGFGLGIQMSAGMYYMTETVNKDMLTQAFGLYMPFVSLAVSVAPVIINSLSKLFFGATTSMNNFKVGFVGYAFAAVGMALYEMIFCKNSMIGKVSGLEEK